MSSAHEPIDIGVITVREDEYEAVQEKLDDPKIVETANRSYVVGQVQHHTGKSFRIALVMTLGQGATAAQHATSDLIIDLDPKWIGLVGIGGAIPESEFTLGDVILATRLHDFTVGAHIQGAHEQFASQEIGRASCRERV